MTEILYGAPVAEELDKETLEMLDYAEDIGLEQPHLQIIRIGNDSASDVYVRNKKRKCEKLGIAYSENFLPAPDTLEEMAPTLRSVARLSEQPHVTGAFVQLPTGSYLLDEQVGYYIPATKDVDGLSIESAGYLLNDPMLRKHRTATPATAYGIIRLLDYYDINLIGKVVGVVGRSNLVGKPVAQLALQEDATVVMMHSRSDIDAMLPNCDIVIVATGHPKLIKAKHIKKGAVVIDVGINRDPETGKLVGDCDFQDILGSGKAKAITPVPKGVGVITVSALLWNLAFIGFKFNQPISPRQGQ